MSGLARRLPFRVIAGRHARLRGAENLRRPCLTALIALVVQFSLGMILNLYVTVPTSDAHAILGAFAAGEIFVRNGQNSASLWMAILTGVALASYIAALNLIRVVSGQPAPTPHSAPRHTQSASQHDLPPWPGRPAVPRQRPLSAPHPVVPQRPPFDDPPRADAWDTAPW
jgi:hypothetical protein